MPARLDHHQKLEVALSRTARCHFLRCSPELGGEGAVAGIAGFDMPPKGCTQVAHAGVELKYLPLHPQLGLRNIKTEPLCMQTDGYRIALCKRLQLFPSALADRGALMRHLADS